MNGQLRSSYAAAERVTAHWAKSFHFASRFLPADKKRAIFAIYDYCRHCDNLVDHRGDRPIAAVRAELADLGAQIRALHAGEPPASPRWLGLADTLTRFDVPLAPLLGLLEGVAMDLEPVAIPDFAALHRYCYLVAGGVGLMIGPVLGANDRRFHGPAIDLGIAMQLTNVLRDVAEDLDDGRVYLPADELARVGLSRASLERRVMTPTLRQFIETQVARARCYFAAADPVIDLFPADGSRLSVRLMQRTYAGILDAIERRDYDIFRGRAYVSGPRKLAMLGRALLSDFPRVAFLPSVRSA